MKAPDVGDVIHLVKRFTHHVSPGSGLLHEIGLTSKTHLTVKVLGKTVERNPQAWEIEAMCNASTPTVTDVMIDRACAAYGAHADPREQMRAALLAALTPAKHGGNP
jgi:hypothetical protein